jgi:hypothetical protein
MLGSHTCERLQPIAMVEIQLHHESAALFSQNGFPRHGTVLHDDKSDTALPANIKSFIRSPGVRFPA